MSTSTKCDAPTKRKSAAAAPSPTTSRPLPSTALFPMHVLGGGSIGLLFASSMHGARDNELRLDHGGDYGSHANGGGDDPPNHRPVTLLMRPHHEPRLKRTFNAGPDRRRGWVAPVAIYGTSNDEGNANLVRRYDVPAELIPTDAAGDGANGDESPIECLLLCTKANDAIPALDSVWDRLPTPSPSAPSPARVIILSNGALAIRDAIRERFGGQRDLDERIRIEFATTTHGAYKTPSPQSTNSNGDGEKDIGHYSITHAGVGTTHCTNEEFSRLCRNIGWESAVLSEFEMNVMLWRKLAANCVINPLTALHSARNGHLLGLEHGGHDVGVVTRHLLEEVSLVASMEMEALIEEDGGITNVERLESAREQLSVSSLEAFVFGVVADTANNISSMLQDAKARRTTEVRYLNGYVERLGREKYGANCPRNMEMCQLVEELLP